ncbi:MAG: hypothetical protein WDO06_07780 [Actinomycetota bacterium]
MNSTLLPPTKIMIVEVTPKVTQKQVTINCKSGKKLKKVVGVAPKCPKGYKKV